MIQVYALKVNHFAAPVGLDEAPAFSWKIESDRRGVLQSKYQLQIARDAAFEKIAFDSGWVECGDSQNVPACGFAPEFAQGYCARVRIEACGEKTDFSAPVRFVTGMLGQPWQAKFVTAEVPACPESSKNTYLRGSFTVDGEVETAVLFTAAQGVYVPYLNGQRVGEDLLAPGWTSYHRHALAQANDVTALLAQGENALGAMLGAGWYKGKMSFLLTRNNYGDRTALMAQLVIRYADGRVQIVASDESWQGCDGPVTFSEIYDGESYDARLEKDGWCLPGACGCGWHGVEAVETNLAPLTAQPGCRIRCDRILPAARLIVTPQGDRVVDFGQVLTGWPEFTLRGEAGKTFTLQCFETLDFDGNVYTANLRTAQQLLKYTCKSGEAESFHPEFTFYGFRYLHLTDWPEDASAADFRAWVIHSEMEATGEFECSEPLVNQLHHNILWGMKGNFLDVPTDCPQRDERMGWTGDAQIFCRTSSFLMDVYSFYRKWLKDVRADQTPDGGVSHVVPDMITGRPEVVDDWLLSQGTHSAAGWADAAIICPWTLYLAYGDRAILEESYGSMKAWIDFMRTHAVDYIWNYKLQFGDWVALDAAPGSYFGATPNDLTCTAYYAYSTSLFVQAARALGREDDVKTYSDLYDAIVDKFRRTFFDENGDMTVQTQTAHILALHFHLAAPEHRKKTAKRLTELLEKEGGHLVTGFMGTTFFTHALADNGYTDAAYDLLLKEDFPSWLYQVKMGATTVWEHWDGMRPDGEMWSPDMNSFNHYAYGAIGEWLYRGVAGLNADFGCPGYRRAILTPKVSARMEHARAALETVYGRLSLGWAWEGEDVHMQVTVPANTTARLSLDWAQEVIEADGVAFEPAADGLTAELPSGSYDFIVR